MKKIVIIIAIVFGIGSAGKAQHWFTQFQDTLKGGSLTTQYLGAFNNLLYVNGGFDYAGSTTINDFGVWDGTSWSTYNGGNPGDMTHDMEIFQNKLYLGIGLGFTDVIKYWDGTNWIYPSLQPNTNVYELKEYNGLLYVGGAFSQIGGVWNFFLATFDGSNWGQVTQTPNDKIYALETYNGELYAGGSFDHFGGTEAFGVARYDGISWKPVGGGMDYYGLAMAKDTFNNFLYVGGGCFNVYDEHGNPIPTDGVGLWDGFGWHPVGDGSVAQAISEDALAVYRGDLYVGSLILEWGCLKRWDGVKWDSCQGGVNNTIYSLAVYKDSLYVAGAFSTVNHDSVPQGLATWFMPDTGCRYVKPMVHTLADTFKINSGQPTVNVQFYNNNAYVDSWAWDFGDTGTGNIQNPTHTYTATGTYNVSCTVSHNSCVKTANKTIVVIDNTGIEDYTKESLHFKLYPNPTSGDVTVECTLPPDTERSRSKGELKTHNANGSMKDSYPLQSGENKITIPSTGLVTGVSLVSVFVDGKFILTEKVVKQ